MGKTGKRENTGKNTRSQTQSREIYGFNCGHRVSTGLSFRVYLGHIPIVFLN